MLARRIIVSGVVQGVGYRFFAVRVANELRIKGWVKNLMNGDVEVVAIAPSSEVFDEFLKKLSAGPSTGRVTNLKVDDMLEVPECSNFEIRY